MNLGPKDKYKVAAAGGMLALATVLIGRTLVGGAGAARADATAAAHQAEIVRQIEANMKAMGAEEEQESVSAEVLEEEPKPTRTPRPLEDEFEGE